MLHWFNLELWGPVWPNLAASAITFCAGFVWAHKAFLREMERREAAHLKRHEELRTLIKDQGVTGEEGPA